MQWLQGKKTYILVIIGVIVTFINFLSGDVSLLQFLASDNFVKLIGLLGIGTLRAGVANTAKPPGT